MKPELKQFGSLAPTDFERYPVWVSVHTFDYDESWYEETDEETFRPWSDTLPVDPGSGMFLVRTQIIFSDGAKFIGFITPIIGTGEVTESELGSVQPYLFSQGGALVTFWGGMFGFSDEVKKKTYDLLARTSGQVFPIHFSAEDGLTQGKQAGEIRGFCKLVDFKSNKVEVTV